MQSVVSGILTSGRSTIDIARDYTGTDSQDDVYDFTITSVDKCSPNGGFNLSEPVAGHKCSDILYHAWKDCTISLLLSHCPYANAIRFIQATTKAVVDLSSRAVSSTAFRQSIRLLKRCFNVYYDVLVWVNGGFDWSMGVRVIASISAGWLWIGGFGMFHVETCIVSHASR